MEIYLSAVGEPSNEFAGPGAFGMIICEEGKEPRTYSKGYKKTTTVRLQVIGAISALLVAAAHPKDQVTVITNVRYLVDVVNRIREGKPVKSNKDLWDIFAKKYQSVGSRVKFVYKHEDATKYGYHARLAARTAHHDFEDPLYK